MTKQMKLGWEPWCTWVVVAVALFFSFFYWIAEEQLAYKEYTVKAYEADSFTKELSSGSVAKQTVNMQYDQVDRIYLMIGTFGRANSGSLTLQIFDEDTLLAQKSTVTESLKSDGYLDFVLDSPISRIKGKMLTLNFTAENAGPGNGVALLYNIRDNSSGKFVINGEELSGQMSYIIMGKEALPYKQLYWPVAAVIFVVITGISAFTVGQKRSGKDNRIIQLSRVVYQYRFLIEQLVSRDFKTKYKRSVLGMFWSFLNPLVTMGVQYFVFSTIFNNEIPYFPVYLLIGVLMFGFFTEAVGQGIISIVSNASLITKVYLPKYIYPFTKVMSAAINLLISLVPLVVMVLIIGLPLTKALFLIPLGLFFLLVFCLGMALIMSTAMVFFRDTQFLWGIVSMLWTYLTPIFYAESIIPPEFLGLYRCNPMYQYITFLRTIIIDGRSPEMSSYFMCAFSALAVLILGLWLFKKKQDRFVFYL